MAARNAAVRAAWRREGLRRGQGPPSAWSPRSCLARRPGSTAAWCRQRVPRGTASRPPARLSRRSRVGTSGRRWTTGEPAFLQVCRRSWRVQPILRRTTSSSRCLTRRAGPASTAARPLRFPPAAMPGRPASPAGSGGWRRCSARSRARILRLRSALARGDARPAGRAGRAGSGGTPPAPSSRQGRSRLRRPPR